MIDLIGDIHGHADKLKQLLSKLGYTDNNGVYQHPERKVIFVGDYIDRGPQVRETLRIVRSMVEADQAIALMGNHEYNAICFHYEEREGGHLRKHLIKNILQHYETLKQFQNLQDEYNDYIDWFKTLPLYYETDALRVVHACWDKLNINFLRQHLDNDRLNDELIHESAKVGSPLYCAIEETIKGKEVALPNGATFQDKDGNVRTEIRIKWWEDPARMTYRQLSIEPSDSIPEEPVGEALSNATYYQDAKPVFFGHYWLKGTPQLQGSNICCLDYSVAKGGHLVAYRFDGEGVLERGKLVVV